MGSLCLRDSFLCDLGAFECNEHELKSATLFVGSEKQTRGMFMQRTAVNNYEVCNC